MSQYTFDESYFYDNCFNKHNFNELNHIDFDKLYNIFLNFKQKYPINEKSVFFDIGTNAGSFVKMLNYNHIYNNIHCFEPHPKLSKIVQAFYPYVKMNDFCLGNINDQIYIYIPEYSLGLSSIFKRQVFDKLQQRILIKNTKCMTLDSYCEQNYIDIIDFIKIDVEGAEKTIFEGANKMLSNNKIIAGVFEIGQTLQDGGTSTEEVCNLLKSYGYLINNKLSDSDCYFYLDKTI